MLKPLILTKHPHAVRVALAGVVAGAGGGLCQVSIMGPCTYLVTGAVTGDRSVTTMQRIQRTWTAKGFKARPQP